MKVYISNYRNHWLSPYTILEKVFFWRKGYDAYDQEPPKWLENLCKGRQWILDKIHPRISYIKINKYDTWSMDHTLAPIILPMLQQLKVSKWGAPFVDDEDVPDYLKSMNAPRVEDEWDTDDNFHKRWEWVLDEMIFAFSAKIDDDWQDQFTSGISDLEWVESDYEYEGEKTWQMVHGPNHTKEYDWDRIKAYEDRIQNGFRLFGKYYSGLWD